MALRRHKFEVKDYVKLCSDARVEKILQMMYHEVDDTYSYRLEISGWKKEKELELVRTHLDSFLKQEHRE